MKDLLLFDADSVRIAAGAVTQTVLWTLKDSSKEYSKISEAKAELKEWGVPKENMEFFMERHVYPEPLENCLQVLKGMLQAPLDLVPHNRHKILLTKGKNFRHHLATIAEYKANRPPKPYWNDEAFEYQVKHWDGIYVDNLEADDLVGLWHREDTVCVAIDKDLLTVPGLHWNYKHKEYNEVNEEQALRYFYTQLLTGDTSDNIKGLKGIGPVKAGKFLADCHTEWEMYHAVRDAWMSYNVFINPDVDQKYLEQDTEVDLLETGQLLHMTRSLHDNGDPVLWQIPTQ